MLLPMLSPRNANRVVSQVPKFCSRGYWRDKQQHSNNGRNEGVLGYAAKE